MSRNLQENQDTEPGSHGTSSLIDRLEQALAHAALFGTDIEASPKLGRFIVLRRLGAGGMGIIYEAYDPKLDRKVAVKLMRVALGDSNAETPARLLREAQALARLGHTNVVAVFDVGTVAEHVWLAMELIDGVTLAAWTARGRPSWPEALNVMTQAGRGLEAAHVAGLVHRDFKPDNVMIGSDGRVRVVDFGLAHGMHANERTGTAGAPRPEMEALAVDLTATGAIRGTPAYMAPEQWRGFDVGPSADQFAWSITAWELFFGERPFLDDAPGEPHSWRRRARSLDPRIPTWLRRIVERGLQVEPSHRWPTMGALLSALERGRQRGRMRTGVAVVASFSVVVAGFTGLHYWSQARAEDDRRQEHMQRVAACEAVGAGIFETWNDATRADVREGLVATGVSYAPSTAEKVMPFLDAQAESWREQRTRACMMADLEKTLNAEQLDRSVWCLDERRMELTALVKELAHADNQMVQRAVSASSGLPRVSPCTDEQVLAALPSPPPLEARSRADAVRETMSRARTLDWAGKYPEGLNEVRSALAEAEALDWPPITVAARQLEGSILERTGAYPAAEAASFAAYIEAEKVRAWDVAAAAALELAYTVGRREARHAEGKVWAAHTEVALLFAGDPLGLGEARRLHALAGIHYATGEYLEAKTQATRALTIFEKVQGPDHPDVAIALNGLANAHDAMGEYVEARVLNERALAIHEKVQGPDHPEVAITLNNLATIHMSLGQYAEAKAMNERALGIYEKALGPDHADVADALSNLASIHNAMGLYTEAIGFHDRALRIQENALGPDHPNVAGVLTNLANAYESTGAYPKAEGLYERALAIYEKALGPDHPNVGRVLHNLASVHDAMGAYPKAKDLYQQALAVREKALGSDHPEVGETLNNLAGVYRDTGKNPEAKALFERALAIFEKTLGSDHPLVASPLTNLAGLHRDSREYLQAKVLLERALAIWEKALGPDHPDVAYALAALGDLELARNRPAAALVLLERAIVVFDKHEGVQQNENEARFSLARAVVSTGGDRQRALAEARKAADGFREVGKGMTKELANVKAFLAKHEHTGRWVVPR